MPSALLVAFVTPIISVATEYTVAPCACQALFTCPFSGLPRHSPRCYLLRSSPRNGLEKFSRPMLKNNENRAARILALLPSLICCLGVGAVSEALPDDDNLSAAVCPIVYQLDQSPSSRGYHYSFFGNGFFINEQGYLLTAAHVLETFRNGGQPYILVSRPNSPPILHPANPSSPSLSTRLGSKAPTPSKSPGKTASPAKSFPTNPPSLKNPPQPPKSSS